MLYVKWVPRALPVPVFGHRFETFRGYEAHHTSAEQLEITLFEVGGSHHTLAGQQFDSAAGDIVVWPPCTRLDMWSPPRHAHVTAAFVTESCELLSEEAARDFVTARGGIAPGSGADYCLMPVHVSGSGSAAGDLLARTVTALRGGETASRLGATGLFLQLCQELTRIAVRQLTASGVTPTHVEHCRAALDYIAAHYRDPLSVETVAAVVGLTPNYLCALFRRTVGSTLVQFITQYRIGVAKELLLFTDASVHEIAQAVGFDDAAYFCRVFKKQEGASPSKWRGR